MKQNNEQIAIEKQGIAVLSISDNILALLSKHKITTLKKLSHQKWRDLINLGLSKEEAKKVEIELQLQGLDIKRNVYIGGKKNDSKE